MWGIGFKTADTIAQAVGIPHDSPERIKARLQYTLWQAADNGHCYLPQPNLITDATKILEVDRELIGPCLDELVAAEGVVREVVPGRWPSPRRSPRTARLRVRPREEGRCRGYADASARRKRPALAAAQ